MTTKTSLIRWLKAQGACSEALAWARKQKSVEAILATERVDWLEWLVKMIGGPLWDAYEAQRKSLWDAYWAQRKPLLDAYWAQRLALLRSLLTVEAVEKAVKG